MKTFPLLLSLATLLLPLVACSDDTLSKPDAVIAITFPAEGALVRSTRPVIKGTAKNVDEINVNGKPVSVVGGAWEVSVPLTEGQVTVTAAARGAEETRAFRIDASNPLLVISSPKRASFVKPKQQGSGEVIEVRGKATDSGSSVTSVSINDQTVELDAEGNFTLDLFARRGVNVIEVEAEDEAGNLSEQVIGVLYGESTNPNQKLTNAVQIAAYQDSIDELESFVVGFLTPKLVNDLITSQIMLPDGVTVSSISFDPVTLDIVPKADPIDPSAPGFLAFSLGLKNVKLVGDFTLSGNKISLDVDLATATLNTKLEIGADGRGGLSVGFKDAELDLPDGSLKWKVKAGGTELSQEDSKTLTNLVERLARDSFASILDERIIDQIYDPKLLQRKITILGRTLDLALEIRDVTINSGGLFINADVDLKTERFSEIPNDIPGALDLERGGANTPALQTSVQATSDHMTLNRMLHSVWESGLLNQSLKGDDFAGLELPVKLEAGAIALVLDTQVNNYADSTSPAGVRLRPQLPPILELRAGEENSSGLKLRMPEFHVDLLLNVDSSKPELLVTFAMFLDLDVRLVIKDSNLNFEFDVSATADLIDEPLFDMEDAVAEDFINGVLALVPEVLTNSLDLSGEADLTWLKISQPEVVVHGEKNDHLSLGTRVEATPPTTP